MKEAHADWRCFLFSVRVRRSHSPVTSLTWRFRKLEEARTRFVRASLVICLGSVHLLPLCESGHSASPRSDAVEMTYRRFTDSEGSAWEAWEVRPTTLERRMNADRRERERDAVDRRRAREFRLVIPRELSAGWLALQGRSRKIRLSPIPEGWMHLSDEQLAALVRHGPALRRAAS